MEYGLDYAMHRHDIERLEKVSFYARNPDEGKETPFRNMVNIRLAQGWKVLSLFSDADNEPAAIMGVPRPKECTRHLDTVKTYYLRDDDWHCPECLKEQD